MIAVILEGRLGNQLFQYAFAYATAKRLKTNFYIDKSVSNILIYNYFNIDPDFCNIIDTYIFSIKGFKNIFSFYLKKYFYLFLKRVFNLKEISFSNNITPATQLNHIENHGIYLGSFQSEEYFSSSISDIKKQFQIKEDYKKQFDSVCLSLPTERKIVTVHVRRGDYMIQKIALDSNYYHKAIENIHEKDNYYIFISDDPAFVENEFAYLTNKYVSINIEIIDFQFLLHADICILSNSSFSWWGAWLNNKPYKQVFAPRYWLGAKEGREYPLGIAAYTNFTFIPV